MCLQKYDSLKPNKKNHEKEILGQKKNKQYQATNPTEWVQKGCLLLVLNGTTALGNSNKSC